MNAYEEEPPTRLPRPGKAPGPGRRLSEGKLRAVENTAQAGYSSAQVTLELIAEIRQLRAELDLLQAVEPADEPSYPDHAVLVDRRGARWVYSAPADVWHLLDGRQVVQRSARSYRQLERDFGPLRADGVSEGPPPEAEHCNCPAAAVWGATGVMPPGHHWQTTHNGGYLAHDPGYVPAEDKPVPDPPNQVLALVLPPLNYQAACKQAANDGR